MSGFFFWCVVLAASVASPLAGVPPAKPLAPAAPRCTYSGVRADTRELLLHIDQELPRAVAATRLELRRRGEADYLRDVWLDSCFSQVPLQHAYYQDPFIDEQYLDALRHQLTHYYVKPLEPRYDEPHAFNLQVLEYASDEAAATAQHLQDSTVTALLAQCRDRDHKLEPCLGIEYYRVSRHRNCLVRHSIYSPDPMDRVAMRQVLGNLRY